MPQAGGAITTIAVGGFPADAQWREMTNLCRLCNGYEGSKVNLSKVDGRPSNVFIKFSTYDDAAYALQLITGMAFDLDSQAPSLLKADFARRDLVLDSDAYGSPQSAVHSQGTVENSAKRQRLHAHVNQDDASEDIDTLACKINGQTEDDFVQFFQNCPGFVGLVFNDKIGVCFAKFLDHASAQESIGSAVTSGFIVDFAKRNFREIEAPSVPDHQTPSPIHDPSQSYGAYKGYPGKGSHGVKQSYAAKGSGKGGGIDTLACKIDNWKFGEVREFLQSCQGFLGLSFNENAGVCFAKFTHTQAAQSAMDYANSSGLSAEFARRNLDIETPQAEVPATTQALVPPMHENARNIDTLACKVGETPRTEISRFFEQCKGFTCLKFNDRIGVCFIKFQDPNLAVEVLEEAQGYFSVQLAKRNLDE